MDSHSYEKEKDILSKILKSNQDNRKQIEVDTRLQSDSYKWRKIRKNYLTSSNFGQICRRKTAPWGNIVKNILYKSQNLKTKALIYGIANEQNAKNHLETELGVKIDSCGFFIDGKNMFLGSSPDGLVGSDCLVEIKCPYSAQGEDIDACIKNRKIKCFNYDKKSGQISLNKKHNYFYQIQGQLNILERKTCIFAIWTGFDKKIKIEFVARDQELWESDIFPKLNEFYNNHLLPEILDPRFKRGLKIR